MIELRQLTLRRGTRVLFEDATATFSRGMRVGIVGRNGSGKTSLLAAILGQLAPDAGDLEVPRNLATAHVSQHTPSGPRSAIDTVLDGDKALRAVEAGIAAAEEAGDGTRIATAHASFEELGGWSARSRAERILEGLGFGGDTHERPVDSFSGGWRMRLHLAQALMAPSDLLLLDEPTNHLDLDAVLWLERWLAAYEGTLVLISHDRDFLDRVTSHILHIDGTRVRFYTGNFSQFERQRAEQLTRDQAVAARQTRRRNEMQAFVDRFRAQATKARQAQSRLKALARMGDIEAAHVDRQFRFTIGTPERLPEPLLRLDRVAAGYGDRTVLSRVSLTLRPGTRAGLVGHNGAGKSTLIRLLNGELDARQGERVASRGLATGYFAQHQLEQLDLRDTAIDHLARVAEQVPEQALRDYLGGFGFAGEAADASVERFSGGERARLVLATLLWKRPNLLLLDEPTNHLDLDMRDALARALQDYAGALVTVSHDRHLLATTTDELWLVNAGTVTRYSGDLEDYRRWLMDGAAAREAGAGNGATPGVDNAQVVDTDVGANPDRRGERQRQAEARRQRQPLKNRIAALEKQLDSLSAALDKAQARLADGDLYEPGRREDLTGLLKQQAGLKADIEQVESDWMEASEELEALSGTA